MIFILKFVENCLYYDGIHNFSVWLRTGSNPADISRFRIHTGKKFILREIKCMFLFVVISIFPVPTM